MSLEDSWPHRPHEQRDTLIAEVQNLDDLGKCFDLSAFPLPIRVGPWARQAGICWSCGGQGLHVYMRILPRNSMELRSMPRDADGMLELNTCTEVDRRVLAVTGPAASVERIRIAIKNMVLHEVYEALLFRGERIMDPHSELKPVDQPF